MSERLIVNYFYGQDVAMDQFYRTPKALYKSEYFRDITFEAKAIYGMLLERVGLSIKNHWMDDDGKTYIIYSIADIMEDTGCCKKKVISCMKELEEKIGLIERKKQGFGKPDLIYVKNFKVQENEKSNEERSTTDEKDIEHKNQDECRAEEKEIIQKDGSFQRTPHEVTDIHHDKCITETSLGAYGTPVMVTDGNLSNKENNYNNNIYNNPILSIKKEIDVMDEIQAYSKIIRENIELDCLFERHPYEGDKVQGIYDIMLETVLFKGESIHIAGGEYSTALVKSKFLKLNMSHVEYVLDCMNKNTTKVRNIKSYLQTALFNSGSTISSFYQAEVNHDMPQFVR